MKRILFFLLVFISLHVSGKEVRCYIYNVNDEALEGVEVKNRKTGQISFSDKAGFFSIEGHDMDTISLMLDNFSPTELTVRNITNSQNKLYLFPLLQVNLSEITVMPADMYSLYVKAVANLKSRLIKNKEIAYKTTGTEKEINMGSQRALDFLFTAKLKKADPRKPKVDYEFLLSNLNSTPHSQESDIMRDNKFWIHLFSNRMRNEMRKSDHNSIHLSDSTILIYDRSDESGVYTFTINRDDTVMSKISYEMKQKQKKYTRRRTFKAKYIHSSFSVEFADSNDGYYLSEINLNFDTSFLTGKPQREERLICIYKISATPDTILNAQLKFKPNTQTLYKMSNYP